MTKGNWRRTRAVNNSYRSRHKKKSSKGAGIYALQLPGAGPNGTHVQSRPGAPVACRCGGCSGRRVS